jgi:hypothetical protein
MPDTANHTNQENKNASPKKRGVRKTQIEKIVDTACLLWDEPKPASNEMAFLSRILVQAFLPHKDPKEIMWSRTNGDFTLDVKSGIGRGKDGKPKLYGVPYGSIPRLLMAYINTEALRNSKDPNNSNPQIISLGASLSQFLEKLGYASTGGQNGSITRFKNQAEKLFHSEITVIQRGTHGVAERDIKIADGRFIFWDLQDPEQQALWESSIELSDRFYNLLIQGAAPMDWRILKTIKQSPMALDLYMWLTHRMGYLNKPVRIKWETLQLQLGADIENIRHFRSKVRQHLKKIEAIWQDLNIDATHADYLMLYPSDLLITPTKPKTLPKKGV